MPQGQPIMPTHPRNPVGQVDRIRRARSAIRKRLRAVKKDLLERFEEIPRRELSVNAMAVNERRYEYLIDLNKLEEMIRALRRNLGDLEAEALIREVEAAYEEGTANAVENLSKITDEYTRTTTGVIQSPSYQRRWAMIRARVFEEMEGFSGQAGNKLGRVLREGISNGRSPMSVKKDLQQRFGVNATRAERIARTEITQAHRRARWDERDDAEERLGIRTKLMHLSALLPTTRKHHARRHGELYTSAEVREWYAQDANAINCRCSQVEVLVDENGEPRTPGVVDEAKSRKARVWPRG